MKTLKTKLTVKNKFTELSDTHTNIYHSRLRNLNTIEIQCNKFIRRKAISYVHHCGCDAMHVALFGQRITSTVTVEPQISATSLVNWLVRYRFQNT